MLVRLRFALYWCLLAGVAFLAQPSRLDAQPASATNRVLDLDGNGGNVELPAGVFDSFKEATIEAWVKFGTQDDSRFFSYGGYTGDLCLGRQWDNRRQIQFFINSQATGGRLDVLSVPDDIRIGRWYHVAAVCSTNGMRLHLNGVLVATNDVAKSFHSTTNGPNNIGLRLPFNELPSFTGQVDEFRVWKIARSNEQIRQAMNTRLTGTEPGLAALWNFDDPQNPGKDATTNGYHGKLVKGAKTVEIKPTPGTPFSITRQRKVLDLDGNDSYAELPPNIFTNLQNATIEARVRWFSFRMHSRVFDFGAARSDVNVQNRFLNPTLHYEIDTPPAGTEHNVEVQKILRPGQWVHVAAVSGANGMKLYYNGILVGTNAFTGTIASLTNALQRNLLGRSNWKVENPDDADFHGQIDELRVWSVERTPEEIQRNIDTEFTGAETNLAGLWTFEDGTMRDLTSRTNHGKLFGNARIVSVDDPTQNSGQVLTVTLSGKVQDATGRPLAQASVWLETEGRVLRRADTDVAGSYRLMVSVPPGELDLCVQSGDLGTRKTIKIADSSFLAENLTASPNVDFSGVISAFGERNYLAGVIVQALKAQPGGSASVVATLNTDETGVFKFTNLKPGDYQLRYQIATGFEFFEKGKVFEADERNPVLGLNVRMGPFKRGVWRPFSVGGSQSSQGFQGARTVNDSAAVLVESSGLVWASSSMGPCDSTGVKSRC